MLVELTIENFAIIERLQVSFHEGFNVLTGETGAGKSIIVDAVASVLGGRLEQEQIRAGASQASVEAVFEVAGPAGRRILPILQEHDLLDEAPAGDRFTLILRRDLRLGGRSVCRVNGRAVPLSLLQEIGQYLVDIHGQGDNTLLLRRQEQLGFLDRYGGLVELREQVSALVRELRRVRQELEALRQDEREIARRVDRLQYELQEIEAAKLYPGEEEELKTERDRLANAEHLAELADAVCKALYESEALETPPAVDLLSQALEHLTDIARFDASMEEPRRLLEAALYQIEDIARTMREYRDSIEFNPHRLEQIEQRLSLIYSLRRKYGDTIPDILAYAERARQELSRIEHAGEHIEALEARELELLREIGRAAGELSERRRAAAEALCRAVEQELAELRMEKARFAISLTQQEDPAGAFVGDRRLRFDATGVDQVEFLISANPGEPLRSLALVASGGETSRLMLALKNALNQVDEVPTLIFDEIDAGIGGVVATLVGQKLRRLAGFHQVLCVTHLPQLAAAGDVQYLVTKAERAGRTVTFIRPLSHEERLEALAGMLGAVSAATLQSAQEMLERART